MFPSSTATGRQQFGQTVDNPKHKGGICTADEIPALLKHCGVSDESGNPIKTASPPFQGFARQNGQKWQLRIEPFGTHAVGDDVVPGHEWAFHLAAGGEDQNR